jgi:hypothetical protein
LSKGLFGQQGQNQVKTLFAVAIIAALCTGVVKQNLVSFEPKAVFEVPSKIENKLRYLSCYNDEHAARKTTGLSAAQAAKKCKTMVKLHNLEQAIEERDYDKALAITQE